MLFLNSFKILKVYKWTCSLL